MLKWSKKSGPREVMCASVGGNMGHLGVIFRHVARLESKKSGCLTRPPRDGCPSASQQKCLSVAPISEGIGFMANSHPIACPD